MEYIRYGQQEQHYADKKFVRQDGSVFPGGHWISPRRTGDGICNGFEFPNGTPCLLCPGQFLHGDISSCKTMKTRH